MIKQKTLKMIKHKTLKNDKTENQIKMINTKPNKKPPFFVLLVFINNFIRVNNKKCSVEFLYINCFNKID